MSLTIPLSEKAIDIKMNYKEINKDSQIFTDMSVVVNNYVYMVLSVISIIGMIAFIIPYTIAMICQVPMSLFIYKLPFCTNEIPC